MSAKPQRRRFRVQNYRGIDIIDLIDMPIHEFQAMLPARMRRKFRRSNLGGEIIFKKKLKKAKENAANRGGNARQKVIKTHQRNVVITPDMISSKIAVYNGKEFKEFEVKQTMIGYYTGEFSPTKVIKRYAKDKGKGKGSKFMPLK